MKQHPAIIAEYDLLVEIWAKSVKKTHDFLLEKDFERIKNELPNYFPYVDLNVWTDGEKTIGFSGVDGNKLEMLFLDPDFIGRGYGRQIITYLLEEKAIQYVDVNEQNQSAKLFYQVMGFEEYDRSEIDDAGREYPILHLKRRTR